ncbi:MAG: accessory gene regulator B family protein [Eubacterium sp.]|nr:accessory gene regulator B family protein [Eubacterium sp.]MBR6172265.1 accessory gene regulator B family protein [Eubacterium sp.]
MIISKKASESLVSCLCHADAIDSSYAAAYQFTLEQLFDILIFHMSILIIGLLFHRLSYTCVYILALTPTKMMAGGAHAKTRGLCSLISYSLFLMIVFLCPIIPISTTVFFLLLIPITFLIVAFAPVNHPNKIIDPHQGKKRKRHILIYLSGITIIGVGLAITGRCDLLVVILFCLITVLINQAIGRILYREVNYPLFSHKNTKQRNTQ